MPGPKQKSPSKFAKFRRSMYGSFILILIVVLIVLVILSIIPYLHQKFAEESESNSIKIMLSNGTESFLLSIKDNSISIVLIFGSALVIAFLLWIPLFRFYFKVDEIYILPFDVNHDSELDGRAISDMIISELRRIRGIHGIHFEIRRSERLPVPSERPDSLELDAERLIIREESQKISESIGDVGRFTMSGLELPIGPVILALNRIRPLGERGCYIHGSIHKHGSYVYAEAHIRSGRMENESSEDAEKGPVTCSIKDNLKYIGMPDLIRDLAYNVAYELSFNPKLEKSSNPDGKKNNSKYHKQTSVFIENYQEKAKEKLSIWLGTDQIEELNKYYALIIKKLNVSGNCLKQKRHIWLFDPNEIREPEKLARELHNKDNPFSKEITKRLGDTLRDEQESKEDELRVDLAEKLNILIRSNCMNDLSRYIVPREETKRMLEEIGDRKKCLKLNRLILEDAYSSNLKNKRVKSWAILKYFTNALELYNSYITTSDKNYLNRASDICNKSITRDDRLFFGLFYNIGIAYFDINNYIEAEKMFSGAARINPLASVYAARGICFRYCTQFKKAMEAFETAICYDINDEKKFLSPAPWNLFGGIYMDLGCYASDLYNFAMAGFYKAILCDPDHPFAYFFLGIVYHRKAAFESNSGKKENYNYLAYKCVMAAMELARKYGYKEFITPPLLKAACLLQSVEEDLGKPANNIDYEKMIKKKMEANECLLTSRISDAYNRACLESLLTRKEYTLQNIEEALRNKRTTVVQTEFDPDFEKLIKIYRNEFDILFNQYPLDEERKAGIKEIICIENKYIRSSFEAVCGDKREAIHLLKLALVYCLTQSGKQGSDLEPDISRFERDRHFESIRDKLSDIAIAVVACSPLSASPGSKIEMDVYVLNLGESSLNKIMVTSKFPNKMSGNKLSSEKDNLTLKKKWDWNKTHFTATTDKDASGMLKIAFNVQGLKESDASYVNDSDRIFISLSH